jgi:hypothetical protein
VNGDGDDEVELELELEVRSSCAFSQATTKQTSVTMIWSLEPEARSPILIPRRA